MTTYTLAARRNQNLYRSRSKVMVGPVSGGFVTIAAICLLALLYLTQITKTSVFGTRVNELRAQKEKLLSEKRDLEIEAARLQSIKNIESAEAVKGLVAEGNATFIK